jgi:protein involved in polysaccharide export with SLBB domain
MLVGFNNDKTREPLREQGSRGAGTRLARLFLLAGFALFAAGCAAGAHSNSDYGSRPVAQTFSPQQCIANAEIQAAADTDGSYQIQPGDQLDVSFYLSPEFNDSVTVRPDGKITLRLIGAIQAAGDTPTRLAEQIDKDYESELRAPQATVRVKSMPNRVVYVEGQVSKPGAIALAPGMTALQAIADAGGLTSEANDTAVLVRRDVCGTPQKIDIALNTAMNDPASDADMGLMPRDILLVPRSGIADLNLFVQQYITKMIPVSPYMPLPVP